MKQELTIDRAGRIVLPKPVRDKLHLEPGDKLAIAVEQGSITLKPQRNSAPLRKERGLWVYRTGRTLRASTVNQLIDATRLERERSALAAES